MKLNPFASRDEQITELYERISALEEAYAHTLNTTEISLLIEEKIDAEKINIMETLHKDNPNRYGLLIKDFTTFLTYDLIDYHKQGDQTILRAVERRIK